jgi:hypothetical protein
MVDFTDDDGENDGWVIWGESVQRQMEKVNNGSM